MNELPQPSIPVAGGSTTQLASHAPAGGSNVPQQLDEKVLQEKAIEQIEGIVLKTAANPSQRADEIHAVKDAYMKARFGIDLKGKGPYA